MKKRKIILSESDLRVAVRNLILKNHLENSNLIREQLGLSDDFVKAIKRYFSDPSNLKPGGNLAKKIEADEWWATLSRGTLRGPEEIINVLQWLYTPVGKSWRAFSARNKRFISEGLRVFGDDFRLLDDILDDAKNWDEVINPGNLTKWKDAGIVKIRNVEGDLFLKTRDGRIGGSNLARMWPHVNGQPLPPSSVLSPDSAKKYTLIRKANDSNPIGPNNFKTIFPDADSSGKISIGDWKNNLGATDDLGNALKFEGKTLNDLVTMLPKTQRAGIIALYYGVTVPLELAVYNYVLGASPVLALADEIQDYFFDDGYEIEMMFSDRIYQEIQRSASQLSQLTKNRVTTGGGSFYVVDGADQVPDLEKFKTIMATYKLFLKVAEDGYFSRTVGSLRDVYKILFSPSATGRVPTMSIDLIPDEEMRSLVKIAGGDYNPSNFTEDIELLKAAWSAISKFENLSLGDFSRCFTIAAGNKEAGSGTKHFFRELFGEEIPGTPAELPGGESLEFLELGAIVGPLYLAFNEIQDNLAKKDYSSMTPKEKQAADLITAADLNDQVQSQGKKKLEETLKSLRKIEDIEEIIRGIHEQIRGLPAGYLWDISSEPPVRKNQKLDEDGLRELAGAGDLSSISNETIEQATVDWLRSLEPVPAEDSVEILASDPEVDAAEDAQKIADDFNNMIASKAGMGFDISAVTAVIAPSLISNRMGTAVKDRIMSSLTNPARPESRSWPRRLAFEEFDNSFADGFVSPTALEMKNKKFTIPRTTMNENEYEAAARKLIATFSKIAIVSGTNPEQAARGIVDRINDAKSIAFNALGTSSPTPEQLESFFADLKTRYSTIAMTYL